jgi:Fe-S oxidoreductase
MRAFEEFKSIWDPEWKMNPGKVILPYRADENLRYGSSFMPMKPETIFTYPNDGGSFMRGIMRCVGVGECRKTDHGTMCPSYRATHEEEHSTRGRARLLFEMMQGDVLKDGWKNESVKESLDLCLACKGCKVECPTNVDMATYKAEFLSHFYEGRMRPRSAYAMGLIYWWARAASKAPAIANILSQAPLVREVMKLAGGISPSRSIPKFSPVSFRKWFQTHKRVKTEGTPVVLFPDTFTNYFHPEIGQAAVEILESAGYTVIIPEQELCCGRPLYDHGMLKLAKKLLERNLAAAQPWLSNNIPIIGLEPSCVAVFRDEMPALFSNDERAKALSSDTFTLAEFVTAHENEFRFKRMEGRAMLHGHCHQKAVMGSTPETKLLQQIGFDLELPDTGCCGMAGSFGFEREHYDVSMMVGELAFLPAIRRMHDSELIIADGFSCREQASQATGRTPLHLAQVLQKAIRR